MGQIGRLLVFLGVTLVITGLALILLARTNIPLGRLPGDIVYRGKNTTVFFPLMTSIVLSVVLSLIFYLIGKFR